MSLLDIASALLILGGIGTAVSVVLVVPVIWDRYQQGQIKKRRDYQP